MIYDIAIIGAGVTGSMIARRLARYDLKIALIEKCNDVGMGSSKANSGIVHAGFDAREGTLMAKLNVRGSAMMPEETAKLNVPYKKNGSFVLAFCDEEEKHLEELLRRGVANGVPELKIIGKEELHALEPNVAENAQAALWAPTAAVVCPYELTIGSAECAVSNGVEFIRNCEVTDITVSDDGMTLITSQGEIEVRYIINAAGLYADKIAAFAGDDTIKLNPRRGEYFLLDRSVGDTVSRTIFQCPTNMGKGILVAQTVDGNLLLGPSSEDTPDRDYTGTSWEGLNRVRELAAKSVPCASTRDAITSFTGLRARSDTNDFIISVSEKNPRLINAAGIESPGLSAAPAIAEYIDEEIISKIFPDAPIKPDYSDRREAPVRFRHMNDDERAALIAKNPQYGRIVCRCETVTEGEIRDAIRAPAGARDVDGVKRRTRAGMGRCQGGFCGSKVVEILAEELGCDISDITKFGGASKIVLGKTSKGVK